MAMSKRELASYKAAASAVELKTQRAFMAALVPGKDREEARREFKLSEKAMWGILFSPPKPPSYSEVIRKEALAVPKETRQKVLDRMWEGITIGAAQEEFSISLHAVLGILALATKTMKVLSRVAK
jgi:hypothetical protein